MPIESKRDDGFGHWPRGKSRNADVVGWDKVVASLRTLLDDHARDGVISRGALAESVGISRQVVTKYLADGYRPAPAIQRKIAKWVRTVKRKIETS